MFIVALCLYAFAYGFYVNLF